MQYECCIQFEKVFYNTEYTWYILVTNNLLICRKEDVERELEEFQENSQMLEKELETSLEQAEKANRELRQRNTRLATEVEQLRTRLDQQTADCAMFQSQAQDLQLQHEQLMKYIRELEQKNDDLERAHRYVITFTKRYIINLMDEI